MVFQLDQKGGKILQLARPFRENLNLKFLVELKFREQLYTEERPVFRENLVSGASQSKNKVPIMLEIKFYIFGTILSL